MKKIVLAALLALAIGIIAPLVNGATLLPNARQVFIDHNGAPLANGSVYFYAPNTSSPKNTWQDAGQTILNVNPVALDAAGSAIIYGNGQYRQQVYDVSGNLIWDQVTQDIQGLLGVYWGGTSGGTANAQTIAPSQPLISYSVPLTVSFVAGFTNTNATTVNISGVGNKNVFKITSSGPLPLAGGEIVAGNVYQLIYDGTQFQLVDLLPGSTPAFELVNAQAGSTYTFVSGDLGKLVTFSNAASATLPQASSGGSFANGWFVDTSNVTSGAQLNINPTISTIDGLTTLALSQNQGIRIVSDGTNYHTVRGMGTGSGGGQTGMVAYSAIAGLLPTAISASTNTNASITITAGQAADTTSVVYLNSSGFSWATSNGNAANGYEGGTTLPNSSTIHFFIVNGASGTASFASTSLTPTIPTGYGTYYRRIFSLYTNGSGVLVGGTPVEANGGSIVFWLTTIVLDVNVTVGTSATLNALSVPGGIKVSPLLRAFTATTTGQVLLISSPDETDVAPTGGVTAPGSDVFAFGSTGMVFGASPYLTTNTSSQIRLRGNGNINALVNTRGWIDYRR